MATRNSTLRRPPGGSLQAGTNPLPSEVETLIDDERRNLMQACELLAAMAIAYESDPEGLDYADAALAVRGMIDKAVAAIDPTALRLALR